MTQKTDLYYKRYENYEINGCPYHFQKMGH